MENDYNTLESINLKFDMGIGVTFTRDDAEMIAYKPGIKVEMGANGDTVYCDSSESMSGRYFYMVIDEKKATKKLDFINDHSYDEIAEVTAVDDDDRARVMRQILDYNKTSAFGKTSILFRAAK
ncbi:MAG: hypothetical protein ORN98_02215 [Alphaproteobacteria bacterium]|nr:hypothetical protein [Alphaproteobacteria bacterium]